MSAGSGISPSSATLGLVDEIRKNNTKYVFGLFKVSGTEVIPDSLFPSTDNDAKEVAAEKKEGDVKYAEYFKTKYWPKFIAAVAAAGGPRFGVVDFCFITDEGRFVKNLVSVSYCPDKGTPAREKMTFASTKTAFEAKINVGKKVAANDVADLEYASVLDTVKAK